MTVIDPAQTLKFLDHVYFVHPSTDISVDISTDSRSMYRSTYRLSIGRYVDRYISVERESVDMSTEMCRSTYRAPPAPSPPQNKMYILEQKFIFLKYRAKNLKFAGITLLSLRQQNAYAGNEYILSIMQCKTYN